MTDTPVVPAAPGEVGSAPSQIPIPPEVQAELDRIRDEIAAQDAAKVAAAQAEIDRNAKLDTAKAVCFEKCGPISALITASTDPREKAALQELEARYHAEHAADLEAAYLEHAGQREGQSNPATPGETTPLASNVTVASESSSTAS